MRTGKTEVVVLLEEQKILNKEDQKVEVKFFGAYLPNFELVYIAYRLSKVDQNDPIKSIEYSILSVNPEEAMREVLAAWENYCEDKAAELGEKQA